jgi:hypothetical protein
VTRLEWLDSDFARVGIELGIVRPDIFAKYIRYSIFIEYSKKHDKATAIQLAADECRCEQTTIYRAIEFFCI